MLKSGEKAGRYVIESVLGEGGMGIVYQAHDEKLDRKVALKMVAASDDEEGAARVLREARAAAALDHPNAIAIYDVGESNGAPYIAMELVQGVTLRVHVGDEATPVARKIRWLVDVARALDAAHRAGIVHRDVKPENVMVRPDGRIKVLDFGIARRSQAPVDASAQTARALATTMTTKGIHGTPMYMAPEQIRGKPADGRTDQFSWGVVAYELLEGTRPWEAEDALGIVAAMMSEPPRTMQTDGVPEEVKSVVTRALSRLPAERFGAMADVVELLEPFAESAGKAAQRGAPGAGAPRGGGKKGPGGGAGKTHGKRYSTTELGQAIALALERKAKVEAEGGKYAYADLAAAAREVGIEEEELRGALSDLRPALAPTPEVIAEERRRQKQILFRHAGMWSVFSVFFCALDIMTSGGSNWWFFPTLAWGVGLAAHAVAYFFPVDSSPDQEERHRRRLERHKEKLARRQQVELKQRTSGGAKVRIEAKPPRERDEARLTEEGAALEALAEEEAASAQVRRRGR